MMRFAVVLLIASAVYASIQPSPSAAKSASASSAAQTDTTLPSLTDMQLLDEIQHRAFRFFWEKSDPTTGLTNDRAKNRGEDDYTVASTASTGYALAALPVAVTHNWIDRQQAYDRALTTLRFIHDKLPNVHGWHYHFIDKRTGERVWKCELSSIDTCLLVIGALTCGQYFQGTEVERLANAIYDRIDWNWMRTNGGTQPRKKVVSMGWKPEDGWIKADWNHYCELMFLYLLGLGAKTNPLPTGSWKAWKRDATEYAGIKGLAGEYVEKNKKRTPIIGPIFMYQMAHGYYKFQNQKDSLGWDYWQAAIAATKINRQFCIDQMKIRKTYGPNVWGLNANDAPDGYRAYMPQGEEDGTVCPTGAVASLPFTSDLSLPAAQTMYTQYGAKIWGRYGFSDAFNVDKDWYDPDVIGIDLGMALVAIENYRTGLIWKLLASHPATGRAWAAAGFHST